MPPDAFHGHAFELVIEDSDAGVVVEERGETGIAASEVLEWLDGTRGIIGGGAGSSGPGAYNRLAGSGRCGLAGKDGAAAIRLEEARKALRITKSFWLLRTV